MKLESLRQIFEKMLKYQILYKAVKWRPSSSMRTDRQTWRSCQSLFRNFPKALKTVQSAMRLWVWGQLCCQHARVINNHADILCTAATSAARARIPIRTKLIPSKFKHPTYARSQIAWRLSTDCRLAFCNL